MTGTHGTESIRKRFFLIFIREGQVCTVAFALQLLLACVRAILTTISRSKGWLGIHGSLMVIWNLIIVNNNHLVFKKEKSMDPKPPF